MSVWRSETAMLTPAEKKVELLFYFLLDHNVPGIGDHVGKTLNLHRFLQTHRREPDLWRRVRSQGKPIFTKAQLARFLRTQTTQTGGGISAGTDFFDKIIDRLASKFGSFAAGSDASTTAFSTCLFSFPSLPGVKPVLDFASLVLFLPWHAEQIPVLGPLVISPALDSASLGIPASAEMVEAGLTLFTAIPVIGTFVLAAATSLESILMAITTLLNLGRAQYGSAFQTSLGIVPHFGDALLMAAQQLEKGLERIQTRLDKGIGPLREFTPTGAAAVQQYVPSLEEYTGPTVPLTKETVDTIKAEVMASLQEKAKQDPRFQQLQTLLQTVTAQVSAVVPPPVLKALENNDIPGALRELQNVILPPQLLESLGKVREVMTSLSSGEGIKSAITGAIPTVPTVPTFPQMPTVPTFPQAPSLQSATNTKRNTTNRKSFEPQTIRKRKTRRYRRR